IPARLYGGLAVDPLGAVGDGGAAAFEARMQARTPERDRARAEELDQRAMRGEASAEEALESLRLSWGLSDEVCVVVVMRPRCRAAVTA
ncbi:MAG: hypothetical protein M3P39_00025, partial [Actinomycetota bacterium]|nr:hypothetical protein [Actinomycetota bacterium]